MSSQHADALLSRLFDAVEGAEIETPRDLFDAAYSLLLLALARQDDQTREILTNLIGPYAEERLPAFPAVRQEEAVRPSLH